MPKISVIMPMYKVEHRLKQCIESILHQTYGDFELILINDGSPDRSGEIAEEYSKTDSRIIVIHKENGGVSTARNRGLDIAKGEYIVFVDADDFLEPITLEKMLYSIQTTGADIAIAGKIIDFIEEDRSIIQPLEMEGLFNNKIDIASSIYYLNKSQNFDVLWNKMYKRDIIFKNHIRFEIFATTSQDLIFNKYVFEKATSIVLIKEAFYHYIKSNEESIVTRYHKDMYLIMSRRYKCVTELFEYFELKAPEHISWLDNAFLGMMNVTVLNLYRKDCPLSKKEKRAILKEVIVDNKKFINLIHSSNPTSVADKILKYVVIVKNTYIIDLIYTTLFFIRNNMERLYKILVKNS